jgi:hypothetical protein
MVKTKAQARRRLKEAAAKIRAVIMWWPKENAAGDKLFKIMRQLNAESEKLK